MSLTYYPPTIAFKLSFKDAYINNRITSSEAERLIKDNILAKMPDDCFVNVYKSDSRFSFVVKVACKVGLHQDIICRVLTFALFKIEELVTSSTRRGCGFDCLSSYVSIANGHQIAFRIQKNLSSYSQEDYGINVYQPEKGTFKGSVYILHDPISGWYKIGKSKNAIKRKKDIERGTVANFYFAAIFHLCIENSSTESKLECELHRRFEDFRVAGEWFNLTDKHLNEAINYANENYKII